MICARRLAVAAVSVVSVGLLAACSTPGPDPAAGGDGGTRVVEHALGSTEVPADPTRVATVAWSNHEVPLALGVVPVGMAAANFGDDDGDGLLPWVADRLRELDAPAPVLFDETDGIDFEAVAETRPEVILAGYSGLTQEEYDRLSEIAPTVAYPETAWGTPWRETIRINAAGMGREAEGAQLVADLERRITEAAASAPELASRPAMFLTHVDTTDLSQVSFYTTHDTRTQFFTDLGIPLPESLVAASAETEAFSSTVSTEQADAFSDVGVIVTYGGDELRQALRADPVLSQMPAVAQDAIVTLPGAAPVGTAANPTPLAIPYILDEYVGLLAGAGSAGR
ncbi:iron-siderophore ABC transporter substrate-binding protein [Pseudonocardia sp. HH130630-07]|uniref:iron-siderophore ABC transporter substrate-binding protein n=1 Tax=Pseudonocardia sp. HH130630-07 TaxID=1690815 RepID=UPI000814BC81|nr:iron-siderophore ABC transporter substrate-binding protein [Pseudonocardia sp. HH130630-07]ANY08860.1 ABC transporter substrate-binding protein [Pseudonocardia sp. HH130630-07]